MNPLWAISSKGPKTIIKNGSMGVQVKGPFADERGSEGGDIGPRGQSNKKGGCWP